MQAWWREREQLSQGNEELEGGTVVAGEPGTAYVELVACIVSAAEETIGSKIRGGGRDKRGE